MSVAGKKKRKRKQEPETREFEMESDEYFAFIAGYTPGGAPYGITWKEMEQIEKRERMEGQRETTLHIDWEDADFTILSNAEMISPMTPGGYRHEISYCPG